MSDHYTEQVHKMLTDWGWKAMRGPTDFSDLEGLIASALRAAVAEEREKCAQVARYHEEQARAGVKEMDAAGLEWRANQLVAEACRASTIAAAIEAGGEFRDELHAARIRARGEGQEP